MDRRNPPRAGNAMEAHMNGTQLRLAPGGFMRTASNILLLFFFSSACAQAPSSAPPGGAISGEKAMGHVKTQVAFGPRPSGSVPLEKCRAWIAAELKSYGYDVEDDSFEATTPYGPIRMHNLIARKGRGERGVIALASHYETKLMEGTLFVGANDAGSSTAVLLELARVLAGQPGPLDYWFLFLDGEEAFVKWSTFDSTYGSRHLAKRWKEEGVAANIRALILLDMIGDKDLGIFKEMNSTQWLMEVVWETAQEIGLQNILSRVHAPVEDDHIPFLDVGIPSVDIIDLDYEPWHTAGDTIDKVSPESMEKVGRLVLAVLPKLQQKLGGRP